MSCKYLQHILILYFFNCLVKARLTCKEWSSLLRKICTTRFICSTKLLLRASATLFYALGTTSYLQCLPTTLGKGCAARWWFPLSDVLVCVMETQALLLLEVYLK